MLRMISTHDFGGAGWRRGGGEGIRMVEKGVLGFQGLYGAEYLIPQRKHGSTQVI